ncbi:hypothetical protein B4125_0205 [Bacillus paralicheniformis]|nr:hypothetical protein SC10_B2orf04621 [Bacillus paralicheniformis]OLG08629.1 hypothetical protein B4125_0205 [Bacillus paralicheniformis]TWJ49457.1 hypothetical protein CHCC5023_1640 [Bacillus paralicheniformis]TWM20488.1 hypothetical protein CHCC14821_0895 [Bacillus paralicheniformis]
MIYYRKRGKRLKLPLSLFSFLEEQNDCERFMYIQSEVKNEIRWKRKQ